MRQFGVVIFVVLIISGGIIYADETPTSEPPIIDPATATIEPTWTPLPTLTPEPSLTWTPIPTATETPPATPTPTDLLTVTPQILVSETPTLTLEAMQTGTETLISTSTDTETPISTSTATSLLEVSPTQTPLTTMVMPTNSPASTPTPLEFGMMPMESQNGFGVMQQSNSACDLPHNEIIVSSPEDFALAIECVNTDQVIIEAPHTAYSIYIANGAPIIEINQIHILRSVNIYGRGPDSTIFRLSTSALYGFYLTEDPSANATVRFSHITFEGWGHVASESGYTGYGGMFHNFQGDLYIEDSIFKRNYAEDGGGAIYNSGNTHLERNQFDLNEAGGGGAIQNTGFLSLVCNTFKDNLANYGQAILNTGYMSWENFHHNSFIGNTQSFHQVTNTFGYINAMYNYWLDGPVITGDVARVYTNPVLASDPTGVGECELAEVKPLPQVRDVAPEAASFHANAAQFGLPLPFDVLPLTEADMDTLDSKQGYGPTGYAFSYVIPNGTKKTTPYRNSHNIHSGIDFSSTASKIFYSVCSGVVVGYSTTSGIGDGKGLSVRCFYNVNGEEPQNGLYQLSNIIVAYNHLAQQEHEINDVVKKGDRVGITAQPDPNNPDYNRLVVAHLHLEVFLAYGSSTTYHNNQIRINPLLMFSAARVEDFSSGVQCRTDGKTLYEAYFPVISWEIREGNCIPLYFYPNEGASAEVNLAYGLDNGDITSLSQQGHLPDINPGNPPNFEDIQIPQPLHTPEWDLYITPTPPDPDASRLTGDIDFYLTTETYLQFQNYTILTCTVGSRNNGTIEICTMSVEDRANDPFVMPTTMP